MEKKILITTGVIALVGGLATAVTMSSCDPCEPIDKPSVIITLVDADATGVAHVDAERVYYEFTNEDGEVITEEAKCVERLDDDTCVDWEVGHGKAGTYDYHAVVCGETFESSITLEFGEDGCELETHAVDLTVRTNTCPKDIEAPEKPLPQFPPPEYPEPLGWQAPENPQCTLEARFSVVVDLYAEMEGRMIPVSAERAFYTHIPAEGIQAEVREERGELPGVCTDRDCSKFIAGIEQAGKFTVGAEVCGQILREEVEVGYTEDKCHVDPEHVVLTFDGSKCEKELPQFEVIPLGPQCPATGRIPSAFLMPIVQEGDMLRAWPTEELTYVKRGEDREAGAYCAYPVANNKCILWVTGWGDTGTFKAYTSTCDVESSVIYDVPLTDDGCTAKTTWVPLTVDTHGCIATPGPEANPPPSTPAIDGDIKAPSEPDPSDVKAP